MIDPQLFLEALLLEIRGKTISYCAWKKKCKNAAQSLALHQLELAEIASDKQPNSEDLLRELDKAREEVNKLAQKEAEGAECRARVKWQVEGEKPSKYFCSLEKYNAVQKYIPELKVKNDKGTQVIVKDQKGVDSERGILRCGSRMLVSKN